ncbi:MAG TPA: endonuclease/exonuclease/phosphatase family protein [Saprospiraceae bacterium]|nr:endonuclease/exonuclease/phosphatase family protein [Saprospiraceae bacterium]
MRKLLILLFVSTVMSTLAKAEGIINISFRVKTTLQSDSLPLIAATKNWDSRNSFILDLTSNSNFGKTLPAGLRKGWAVFLQANGAWGWNLGNGKNRLDYLPTQKQRINDGKWHEIQMVFHPEMESVWLYFDQKEVAVYNLGDLRPEEIPIGSNIQVGESIKVKKLKVEDEWKRKLKAPDSKRELKVVSWNIWHGGRHNGIEKGIGQTIAELAEQAPDIILMQETYGSGPIIADSLGMTFYLISSNLSIMTKLPIMEVFSPWDDFRLGGAVLQTGSDDYVTVFDVWLSASPSTDRMIQEEVDYDYFVSQELRSRGREALDLFKSIKTLGLVPLPTIIGGDMNSGSHLDWTLANAGRHGGYFLSWPVSKTFYRKGYQDTYRQVYPDSGQQLGYTWSARFKDELQYRIDFIYQDALHWQTHSAGVEGYAKGGDWPSDHALIWSVLKRRVSTTTP